MIARIQTAATLGALALAAAWALFAWSQGWPGWAFAGALLVIGSYSIVLGLEFLCLARANEGDPSPPVSRAQLWRAWWGEVRSAPIVFCWRQPFRSRRWPDRLPDEPNGRRGVLLIHGFLCNRGIWNRWLARLTSDQVPFVAVNLEPVFGAIDDYVAQIDEAVHRLEQSTGLAPLVVAHSMGGLALRRWWAEPKNESRIQHAITIGTPHRGTRLARYALPRNARQMRLGSPWLAALSAREPLERAARMTCYYGHCDNIVFPTSTATMPGADNRHLSETAHVQMADHPAPMQELMRRLGL